MQERNPVHERPRRLRVARHHEAVDAGRRLSDVRGEIVRCRRRNPDALHDLAAARAEVGDEAGDLRVRERVAVRHRDGLAPAELFVGISPEARHPLRCVRRETEEVRRRVLERDALPGGRAVQERDGGMPACIVADHERLRLLRRADQGVDADRLDEPPDLRQSLPGGVVAAGEEEPNLAAGDNGAGEPGFRSSLEVGSPVDQRQLGAGEGGS